MNQVTIIHAEMTYTKEDGYVGKVAFGIEGHQNQYEIALQSKKGNDWGYGLFFLNESGNEDELLAVETMLEEQDDLFDYLIEAAGEKLVK